MSSAAETPLRVGVVGVRRGLSFARNAPAAGLELAAICDTWEEKLREAGSRLGVETCTDFDRLLELDLDAVVLANYFHQHAPYAIRALERGLHVLSECTACGTMAEGVELIEAVERSGKTYMLAENYPYFAYNQEMRRLFREGRVGRFLYGEGEYVHPDPAEVKLRRSVGWDHWRNWLPATYYCTHSIAPVMYITDTRPVQVSAFVIPYDEDDPTHHRSARVSDVAAVLMLRMDNDAVVKSLHGGLRGHQNYTRIHGNRGLMESSRVMNQQLLRVHRAPFDKEPGEPVERLYLPEFPEEAEAAGRTGHGGGDFFTNYHFARAIRSGEAPYLDVYRAVEMAACGILGWRSALADSAPRAVPDLRSAEARAPWREDRWSPFPGTLEEHRAPASVRGANPLSDEAKALARRVWQEEGWRE